MPNTAIDTMCHPRHVRVYQNGAWESIGTIARQRDGMWRATPFLMDALGGEERIADTMEDAARLLRWEAVRREIVALDARIKEHR